MITAIGGTENVNGVDAGLLLVDNLPAWTAWNANPCDPDARNAVVTAIGEEIDDAIKTPGAAIENIVIVGGDGVIPMAAVPDLTEYSNESTFAREILTAGKSNSVSGTVGSGYLLSDDPYATDAGISILGGDHELYVPERNIGRLVETADEIIGQLVNFDTYGGRLDPSTFNDTAAVTGYDFLDDGAQAITPSWKRRDSTSRHSSRERTSTRSLRHPAVGPQGVPRAARRMRTTRSSHRTPTTTSSRCCRPPRTMQGLHRRRSRHHRRRLGAPPPTGLVADLHGRLSRRAQRVRRATRPDVLDATLDWAQLNGRGTQPVRRPHHLRVRRHRDRRVLRAAGAAVRRQRRGDDQRVRRTHPCRSAQRCAAPSSSTSPAHSC